MTEDTKMFIADMTSPERESGTGFDPEKALIEAIELEQKFILEDKMNFSSENVKFIKVLTDATEELSRMCGYNDVVDFLIKKGLQCDRKTGKVEPWVEEHEV